MGKKGVNVVQEYRKQQKKQVSFLIVPDGYAYKKTEREREQKRKKLLSVLNPNKIHERVWCGVWSVSF